MTFYMFSAVLDVYRSESRLTRVLEVYCLCTAGMSLTNCTAVYLFGARPPHPIIYTSNCDAPHVLNIGLVCSFTYLWTHLSADMLPPLFRHLRSASCACLAVARVNPTPQKEHFKSAASLPLRFSRWCLAKLLLLEKVRPLQHGSQQR